jgi:hypothetical protein
MGKDTVRAGCRAAANPACVPLGDRLPYPSDEEQS